MPERRRPVGALRNDLAGWYVIRRPADGAIACLYTAGDGWWALCGHNSLGLPPGWSRGPRVDELLDLAEGDGGLDRRTLCEADPRGLGDG